MGKKKVIFGGLSMSYRNPERLLLSCATILSLACPLSCGRTDRHLDREGTVRFVQITDPHFFLDTSKDSDSAEKTVREKQEKLDQDALSDVWKQLPVLAQPDAQLSFLTITGDFGVEPCSIADLPAPAKPDEVPSAKTCIDKVNKGKRTQQIDLLANLFAASPIHDIYFVAGNNDIASEVASDDGITYFNQLMDDVQKKIDDANKNVQLHNLTRCYVANAAASSCYADIADTPYRMIGFPSYSFKNREPGSDSNPPAQEKQFEIFRGLLDQSRQSGKKALILNHIPLIDDPYTLAQDRYAGKAPPPAIDKDPNNIRSAWSTWNVSKKVKDEWEVAVASDSVAAVLAGHLHDSHQEIYKRPYLWSTANDQKTGSSKLYMAPPLSVKNQDASPVQARGLALVGLDPGQIRYSIYWYNSETHDFMPDRASRFPEEHGRWKWWHAITRTVTWLWNLAATAESLDRMAVLLIAFVAAFLTVVQVWQIPSPVNPNTKQEPESAKGGQVDDAKNNAGASKSDYEPSPFASNFGKTVIMGLGGLAAESVLKSFENKPSANDKEFYVVWFVIFFFLILVLGALIRALGEAVRERISIVHLKYLRTAPPYPDKEAPRWEWFKYYVKRALSWINYCVLRTWYWLLSLRSTLLIFLDTFLNLIQGKNQTLTQVFSKTITHQQRNMICVAQTVRTYLNGVIRQRLLENLLTPSTTAAERDKILERIENPRNVRVNISVMSGDQSRVFYIATAPGSANDGFTQRSVAWVSVFTGKIRWYKHSYKDEKLYPGVFSKIILFDNQSGTIPGDEPTIYLQSHYQLRDDDYEAFIMFPLPWPRRGHSGAVKGAIHISFSKQEDFESIWKFTPLPEKDQNVLKEKMSPEDWQKGVARAKQEQDKAEADADKAKADQAIANPDSDANDPVLLGHTYAFEDRMLGEWCDDPETRASLLQAVKVLGELLHGFNENIYLSSKKDDQCSGG